MDDLLNFDSWEASKITKPIVVHSTTGIHETSEPFPFTVEAHNATQLNSQMYPNTSDRNHQVNGSHACSTENHVALLNAEKTSRTQHQLFQHVAGGDDDDDDDDDDFGDFHDASGHFKELEGSSKQKSSLETWSRQTSLRQASPVNDNLQRSDILKAGVTNIQAAETENVTAALDSLPDSGIEDDFGEFIDSTDLTSRLVISTTKRGTSSTPSTKDLLQEIQQTILNVPPNFISELAALQHPLRQAVLKHRSTQNWLKAVVEGSRIAQRLIHGRNRKGEDQATQAQARLASVRIIDHWKDLIPRLASLSGGSLQLAALDIEAYGEHLAGNACEICGITEHEAKAALVVNNGILGHRSCVALLVGREPSAAKLPV